MQGSEMLALSTYGVLPRYIAASANRISYFRAFLAPV